MTTYSQSYHQSDLVHTHSASATRYVPSEDRSPSLWVDPQSVWLGTIIHRAFTTYVNVIPKVRWTGYTTSKSSSLYNKTMINSFGQWIRRFGQSDVSFGQWWYELVDVMDILTHRINKL